MIVERFLFELTAYRSALGVARMSEWISDEWLIEQLKLDTNLDRVVQIVDPGPRFPLSDELIYFPVS